MECKVYIYTNEFKITLTLGSHRGLWEEVVNPPKGTTTVHHPLRFETFTVKSTNFGVLLYLANLANCVSSLIFVAANIYVDRTLHRRAAGTRQI